MQIDHLKIRSKAILILAAWLCFLCLPFQVNAKTLVDMKQEGTLKIRYQAANAEFSIYQVANVTEIYRFPVTEEFAQYQVDFDQLETEEWKDMAETLAGYVKRDEKEPVAVGRTDENGCLTFSHLPLGVYLVIGEQAQDEDYIYRCKPFLAFLPLETETGSWDYEPEYFPKFSENPIRLVDLTVMKKWEDKGLEDKRPESICIQLLKNGKIDDEITLTKDNNWMYTWEDLSTEYTWQVVEKDVPDGYTVSISEEGNVFHVINTGKGQPQQPDRLPQTGQLWWPVPILAAAGMLFFFLGLVQRRSEDEN